jgi:hypothetical protein
MCSDAAGGVILVARAPTSDTDAKAASAPSERDSSNADVQVERSPGVGNARICDVAIEPM